MKKILLIILLQCTTIFSNLTEDTYKDNLDKEYQDVFKRLSEKFSDELIEKILQDQRDKYSHARHLREIFRTKAMTERMLDVGLMDRENEYLKNIEKMQKTIRARIDRRDMEKFLSRWQQNEELF